MCVCIVMRILLGIGGNLIVFSSTEPRKEHNNTIQMNESGVKYHTVVTLVLKVLT